MFAATVATIQIHTRALLYSMAGECGPANARFASERKKYGARDTWPLCVIRTAILL